MPTLSSLLSLVAHADMTSGSLSGVVVNPQIKVIVSLIILMILLMTREAGVAYKSIKYALCILKAKYTNLANEFTTTMFFDVNK